MIVMWNSSICNFCSNQTWRLEFTDFENNGCFELRLFIGETEQQDHLILMEDGKDFKQNERGKYPYFLYDYAEEVMEEIGCLIEQGIEIIRIDKVAKDVKKRWDTEV